MDVYFLDCAEDEGKLSRSLCRRLTCQCLVQLRRGRPGRPAQTPSASSSSTPTHTHHKPPHEHHSFFLFRLFNGYRGDRPPLREINPGCPRELFVFELVKLRA